ncbi:unnamed protein product [Absidia cylindrospora]
MVSDRHPEIAPSEFTHWLETNGSNNVARKTSLRRKSSVLSNIHIPLEEVDPIACTPPIQPSPPRHQPHTSSSSTQPSQNDEQQQGKSHSSRTRRLLCKCTNQLNVFYYLLGTPLGFDRHSPAQDTSRVLAPRGNRSLLRRSAFSARGRGRKQTGSRHGQSNGRNDGETTAMTNDNQNQPLSATNSNKPTMEPVRLYDRPVSMSEWIDLGSASLGSALNDSQHGILSRVHDAESHLYLNMTRTPNQ